ncbi:phenazine biosynthesis protein phzE [Rhodococcus sp. 27YEA15]|uniref:anthranilate synthase family protein n=1 Tax=Rhodococcus sp. 27YEA15 TaxID=3156259 RepID=UPI003C79B34D
MTALLSDALRGNEPFAIISRESGVYVLVGDIVSVPSLADIPIGPGADGPAVLALIPFRQIRERGFVCHDDKAPLLCLRVREHAQVNVDDVLSALLPTELAVHDGRFEPDDDRYSSIVSRIIVDEIGNGAGANFVIRRDFRAQLDDALVSGLEIFRRLLQDESGSYWTFFVHTPSVTLVGATPERHVGYDGTSAIMNPISGTYRHPVEGPNGDDFLDFLDDAKESAELLMVVDEELKMMSRLCTEGGRIIGPKIKQMGHLTHTEYELVGETFLDPRDILRETMFAPTVTGSPIENASKVIKRYETSGRGYYSGVLALFERSKGVTTLDAPILIRTCEIAPTGDLKLSAGATLVRNSVPEHEVHETRSKLGGVLSALGIETARPKPAEAIQLSSLPPVVEALQQRNSQLASFWLDSQSTPTALCAKSVVVVDFEDQWTAMLAHQLRHLGMDVTVIRWEHFDSSDADLLVCGPGPGNPSVRDSRIETVERALRDRLSRKKPVLAICLSHQVLARMLGLEITHLDPPQQGVQKTVHVFGEQRTLGFYNTFAAIPGDIADGLVSADEGHVNAIRGEGFESFQFHPESVLSVDGIELLSEAVNRLVTTADYEPSLPGK